MSRDNQGPPYKQRFKGLENFLRRVAFNLGNTPSQTEVKIISCIPIDVTDLQQKINSLERELREVKARSPSANNSKNNRVAAIVQTALGKPSMMRNKSRDKKAECKVPVSNHACNTKPKRGFKRKISKLFVVSSYSTEDNTEICRFAYSDSNIADIPTSMCPAKVSKISSKIFPKRLQKALKKKPRRKTQLVYFTQALNSPFNSYDKTSDFSTINRNLLSRAYINKMIRKQYEPELIGDRLTDTSQFSSPVCRDTARRDLSYPSDISCSYGKYENLDRTYTKTNHINIDVTNNFPIDPGPVSNHSHTERNNYNRYYNSDDYDIFPVREKPIKQKKEDVLPKQIKRFSADCWHNNTKVNLSPLVFANDGTRRLYDCARVPYKTRYKNGHEFTITNIQKKKNRTHVSQETNSSEAKICSIDYGDIYVKQNPSPKPQRIIAAEPTFKNAECVTDNTNSTECQTVESKGVQLNIPDENKAEVALTQIKTILQSVLAEVKSNIKQHNVVSRPKKDVVVQKDMSHNNISYGSTLLNSFNYNPSYNINPCLATYPRQVPNFYYANIQSPTVKCLQNFPLIFPNIKHHDFECQHIDNVNEEPKPVQLKPAITTATNTDGPAYTSPPKSETMNLIKEIYKSIALNVNYSSKNTSHISIGYPRKVAQSEPNTVTTKEMTILEQHSGEEKENQLDIPAIVMSCGIDEDRTHTTSTSEVQTEVSSESEGFVNEESLRTINDEEEDKVTSVAQDYEAFDKSESKNENETRSTTVGTERTPAADTETEKKVKPGLLQKMFETVKMLKKKSVSNRMLPSGRGMTEDANSSGSDTDTQTVYSYKTHRGRKPTGQSAERPGQALRREYLKDIIETDRESGLKIQEGSRRQSPYMEQEYRRYWDEKLMFNENKSPIHFSEKSYSGREPDEALFWRGYEARSAMLKKRLSKTFREQCRAPLPAPSARERTGLKLEWLKKQKFKSPPENI
ncbi:PREDICTED: uncharacterized protein LOC106128580 [Papilio xuthus]|uniref:Uncharacterized protein LOC106128580 n=1 Tax=Papilio xuthus TaxID=66420 RepID=A0AAJ6ZZD2_PAPXU|nr:PREDICTED: uncharacterized protein LOC106128580 [Papilio xuthus]